MSLIKLNWVKELKLLENVLIGRCLKIDESVREGTNYHDEVYFEDLSGIGRGKRPLFASVFWGEEDHENDASIFGLVRFRPPSCRLEHRMRMGVKSR